MCEFNKIHFSPYFVSFLMIVMYLMFICAYTLKYKKDDMLFFVISKIIPILISVFIAFRGDIATKRLKNNSKNYKIVKGIYTKFSLAKREAFCCFVNLIFLYALIFEDFIHDFKSLMIIWFGTFDNHHSLQNDAIIHFSFIIFGLIYLFILFHNYSKSSINSKTILGFQLNICGVALHIYKNILENTLEMIILLLSCNKNQDTSNQKFILLFKNSFNILISIFVILLSLPVIKSAIKMIILSATQSINTIRCIEHLEKMKFDGVEKIVDFHVSHLENDFHYGMIIYSTFLYF